MTTRIFTFLLLSFFFQTINAQSVPEKKQYYPNIFYPEIFGNGIGFTFNYERMLKRVEGNCFSMRAGYGVIPDKIQTIPLEAIWLKGIKHHIESGIGITTIIEPYAVKPGFVFAARIGYRYQAPGEHLILRTGATIFFGNTTSSIPTIIPGIAVGFAL